MTGRVWALPPMTGARMTSNDRMHHMRKADITAAWREVAGWHARAAKIPRLGRAHILAEWLPHDLRPRDPANAYPMVKACVDGICLDAGVLADDSSAYLDGPDMRLGELHDGPRSGGWVTLRITVTELPDDTAVAG